MKAESKNMEGQIKIKMAQMKLMAEYDKNQAQIQKLQADAVKALADAKGVESGHAIALIEAQIGAAKNHQDVILKIIEMLRQETGNEDQQGNGGRMEKSPGNEGAVQQAGAE
jgi:hypothetical protein